MKNKNHYINSDIIVIGGGASGLMAAISAARKGANVVILDHNSMCGKKILSTGNGKCNLTNRYQDISCYRSENPDFVENALHRFSFEDTLSFFEEIGVLCKEKNGYFYPRSGQASTVREALILEATKLQIKIHNEIDIQSISKDKSYFTILTKTKEYHAKNCILATGGKASPKTGSDGSGLLFALRFGHKALEPLPALVPLISNEKWLKETAGVRCDAIVSLYVDHTEIASDSGELQMTDYGLSGIPVFQISRYASIALASQKKAQVLIDFIPELTRNRLKDYLNTIIKKDGELKNWKQILAGFVNYKIAIMLCKKIGLSEHPVLSLSEKSIQKNLDMVIRHLKETKVAITGTRHYDQAQVTCGGVELDDIDENCQSQLVPGLFFAGEMMDVDGICGGYNLQWAWTSGFIAGTTAAK